MSHLGSELTSKDTDAMHILLPSLFSTCGEGKRERKGGRLESGAWLLTLATNLSPFFKRSKSRPDFCHSDCLQRTDMHHLSLVLGPEHSLRILSQFPLYLSAHGMNRSSNEVSPQEPVSS